MEGGKGEREGREKKEKTQVDRPGNVCEDKERKQLPPGCGGETMSSALV